MAKKLQEIMKGDRKVKIFWDAEWEEYRVKLWVNGKYQKGADYMTDDHEDAIGTARFMVD